MGSRLTTLKRTVHVDQDVLVTLTQESLEKSQSITRLEESAAELYKALQAGRDTGSQIYALLRLSLTSICVPDMAATMERLQDYKTHNSQFCKRIFDFLSIMFVAQVGTYAMSLFSPDLTAAQVQTSAGR